MVFGKEYVAPSDVPLIVRLPRSLCLGVFTVPLSISSNLSVSVSIRSTVSVSVFVSISSTVSVSVSGSIYCVCEYH